MVLVGWVGVLFFGAFNSSTLKGHGRVPWTKAQVEAQLQLVITNVLMLVFVSWKSFSFVRSNLYALRMRWPLKRWHGSQRGRSQ